MKVRLFFEWRHFWVGIHIDKEDRSVYICPVPMLGIKISLSIYAIRNLRRTLLPHYVIISSKTGQPFGCSCGRKGRDAMLNEEPGSITKRILRKKCPICKGE